MNRRSRNVEYWFKYAVWFFICALLLTYSFFMVILPWTSGANHLLATWEKWQSFNAGMIGLFAASIAVYAAYYQYRNRLKREFNANIALLPSVLSVLLNRLHRKADYCVHCFGAKRDSEENVVSIEQAGEIELTDLQQGIIKNCIANADDELSEQLIKLLHELQVLNSRLSVVSTDTPARNNIPDLLFQLATAYALAAHILLKIRKTDEKPYDIAEDDIPNALANLGPAVESIVRQSSKYTKFEVE